MKQIKNLDSFGHLVTLSYGKGQTNVHQTILGGICTILSRICFMLLFCYSFYKMFFYIDMQRNELYKDIGWNKLAIEQNVPTEKAKYTVDLQSENFFLYFEIQKGRTNILYDDDLRKYLNITGSVLVMDDNDPK